MGREGREGRGIGRDRSRPSRRIVAHSRYGVASKYMQQSFNSSEQFKQRCLNILRGNRGT